MPPSRRPPSGGLVYSTHHGQMCPTCRAAMTTCTCGAQVAGGSRDGIVRVGRETKGRKGSGVTVITGVPLTPADLQLLASELKRKCGSGGTAKDGVIEIQGDHRDSLIPLLEARGWRVKRVGG